MRPRYDLKLSAQTHLVPTKLQYREIGNGSVGYLDGTDFMFDPRPVKTVIPSWRVATRQRHFDLTSPLRLVRKLLAPGADVSLGEGRFEDRTHAVVTLREIGRPAVRLFVDEATGVLAKLETLETHPLPRRTPSWRVFYRDYRSTGGATLPHRIVIWHVDGKPVHDEIAFADLTTRTRSRTRLFWFRTPSRRAAA